MTSQAFFVYILYSVALKTVLEFREVVSHIARWRKRAEIATSPGKWVIIGR